MRQHAAAIARDLHLRPAVGVADGVFTLVGSQIRVQIFQFLPYWLSSRSQAFTPGST